MILMNETLDEFAKNLQERIFEDTRNAYGEKAYQRWLNPVYMGTIKEPDGFARVKGKCGDTMEIFLKFENGRVKEASYGTDGCGSSNICGSYAAEMAIGKNPDEIITITGETILLELGRFPVEEHHCAFLAAETLQEALNDYMVKESRRK
jgi:nitrogen fixation NifU-like protein